MLQRLKSKLAQTNNSHMSLWFVRHGESEGNALGDTCPIMHDTALTQEGRDEALRVASYLQKNDITVTDIYTSPKGRSRETAEVIGSVLGLSVKIKDGLSERDWGDWKDLRWMEASDRLDQLPLEERYTFVPPGGESWKQMESRLLLTLEEIVEENTAGENVLIVMHRGGLRAVLPLLAKAGIERHKEFSVPTGALSKFSFVKEAFDFVGFVPKALLPLVSLATTVSHWF
ncbi:MAG TPA: histidine phosphatase family protein [Candidatus Paceibacterota bacterium]|nr:histidine phosphatase family protein [Candidatus Paceibacterota bacterium]